MPTRALCRGDYGGPVEGPAVGEEALVEISGLVASPSRAGLVWMHNDSGDGPRLYAVDAEGQPRVRLELPVEARDWEDLAAAACPDRSGPCLWVGDIGDNARARDGIIVYAVPEPQSDGEHLAQRVWRFPLTYPGDVRDAEALVVSPSGDTFWLFEKDEDDRVNIYGPRGPLVDGVAGEMEKVGRFTAPGLDIEMGRMVTAADLHPSGERLVLRVYTGIYEYRFEADQGPADLDDVNPRLVAFGPLSEPQGEAVAYGEEGDAILTVSEDLQQQPGQPIHRFPCNPD